MGMDVIGNNPTSEVGSYFRHTCGRGIRSRSMSARSRLRSQADAPTGNRTMTTA